MKAIILQFPKPPCLEKWDMMHNNDLGKHCPVCKTDIFDFSDLTNDELVEILKHAPQKVCGKFRASQIGRPIYLRQDKLESKNPRFKKMLAATVLLAVSTPFLSAQDTIPTIKAPVHVIDSIPQTTLLERLNALDNPLGEGYKATGKVYMKGDPYPMPGVSIWLLESRNEKIIRTSTDVDGQFSLSVPEKYITDGVVKLEFSLVGTKNKIVEVNVLKKKRKPLEVYMEEDDDNIMIGEVIITTIKNDFYDPIYGR